MTTQGNDFIILMVLNLIHILGLYGYIIYQKRSRRKEMYKYIKLVYLLKSNFINELYHAVHIENYEHATECRNNIAELDSIIESLKNNDYAKKHNLLPESEPK